MLGVKLKMEFSDTIGCFTDIRLIPRCKCHFKWKILIDDKIGRSGFKKKICTSEDEYQKLPKIAAGCQPLGEKLLQDNIVEIYFYNISCKKRGNVVSEKTTFFIPALFKCVNLKVLSLRKNGLLYLPADVGRLSKLRTLILTENFLTVQTIPYTLTFCKHLRTLHLDHNFLNALPGFLLEMPHLETVYRHGNQNYFKSTFVWFHSSDQERLIPLVPQPLESEGSLYQPNNLQTHCILSVISSKVNFFEDGLLPVTVQDHISRIYFTYRLCAYCDKAFCQESGVPGFKLFTFKNPYLGNSCVPFQQWVCSRECGTALDHPAQKQEHEEACEIDLKYQKYIAKAQRDFNRRIFGIQVPSCVLM